MSQEISLDPVRVEAAHVWAEVMFDGIEEQNGEVTLQKKELRIEEVYRRMDGRVDKSTLEEISEMDVNEFLYLAANGNEEAMAGLVQAIRESIDDAVERGN
ncbi:hypothetical protein [Thalassomonas haliotis]|uniref:Uncharacterized protein n=1 Tax=Thalassomonas haliotis TaxID=485448 RepID=A0ABY7VGK1_9GAMM|nr:hypothetical protein [Thalassomonas haliotis]WDE12842.1 hypothetical protein H3N35_05070 [Thalassomonas haliotis]